MKFGVHVSVAGGIENAPQRAADLGCDSFQLFISNPRSWALPRVSATQAAAFRSARAGFCLEPVVVHATYLINLASAAPENYARACEHFLAQYIAAAEIGADFLVIHPGSFKDSTLEEGMAKVAAALAKTRQECPEGPVILLENTAGGGNTLGRNPQELGRMLAESGLQPEEAGVCFDTCHAWATGVDLAARGAFLRVIREYESCLWPECIRLLHCNDSLYGCGKGRDRHYHIGLGEIGAEGMEHILRTKAIRSVPVILETPIDAKCDDRGNLAAARAAAAGE